MKNKENKKEFENLYTKTVACGFSHTAAICTTMTEKNTAQTGELWEP